MKNTSVIGITSQERKMCLDIAYVIVEDDLSSLEYFSSQDKYNIKFNENGTGLIYKTGIEFNCSGTIYIPCIDENQTKWLINMALSNIENKNNKDREEVLRFIEFLFSEETRKNITRTKTEKKY